VDNFNAADGNLGVGNPFEQPSRALVNSDGLLRLDYRHALKILGTYKVPRVDLTLSAVFRSESGLTYTPFQLVPGRRLGLAGGAVNVLLEPRGSRRVPASTLLDLRAEKVFTLGGKHRLGVYADALNVFNSGATLFAQSQVPSAHVPGIEQPVEFGAPNRLVPARCSARAGGSDRLHL
jgi:hypothetical protein